MLLWFRRWILMIWFRLLFWSDWDRNNPKIERSNTDGSNRMEFVKTSLKLPNSLTIDYDRDEICWADAGVFKIGILSDFHLQVQSCGFIYMTIGECLFVLYFFFSTECIGVDGDNRRVIVSDVKYPFGLTYYDQQLFWTDWKECVLFDITWCIMITSTLNTF